MRKSTENSFLSFFSERPLRDFHYLFEKSNFPYPWIRRGTCDRCGSCRRRERCAVRGSSWLPNRTGRTLDGFAETGSAGGTHAACADQGAGGRRTRHRAESFRFLFFLSLFRTSPFKFYRKIFSQNYFGFISAYFCLKIPPQPYRASSAWARQGASDAYAVREPLLSWINHKLWKMQKLVILGKCTKIGYFPKNWNCSIF